jgi:hypothetical protein
MRFSLIIAGTFVFTTSVLAGPITSPVVRRNQVLCCHSLTTPSSPVVHRLLKFFDIPNPGPSSGSIAVDCSPVDTSVGDVWYVRPPEHWSGMNPNDCFQLKTSPSLRQQYGNLGDGVHACMRLVICRTDSFGGGGGCSYTHYHRCAFMLGYTDTSSMRYAVQQLVYLYTTGIFVIHPCTNQKRRARASQKKVERSKSKYKSGETKRRSERCIEQE